MHDELFYRVTTSLCASSSWNGMLYAIAAGAWIAFMFSMLGLWRANWRVQAYMRWAQMFIALGVALYPTLIFLMRSVAIDCDASETILRLMPSWPAMHLLVKVMSVVALFCGVYFFWRAWRLPAPLFDDPIVDDALAQQYVGSTRQRFWPRLRSVFTDQALYMDDAYFQLRSLWDHSWEHFVDYRQRMDAPVNLDPENIGTMDYSVLSTPITMHLHRDTNALEAAAIVQTLISRGVFLKSMPVEDPSDNGMSVHAATEVSA